MQRLKMIQVTVPEVISINPRRYSDCSDYPSSQLLLVQVGCIALHTPNLEM